MTRDDIVSLFDLLLEETLAAIDAAGKAHGRKHRKKESRGSGRKTAVVVEHLLTGTRAVENA